MRVLVALSGGVDSSVAAALLREEGHDLVGVTLRLADLSAHGLAVSRCCSPDAVAAARDVARHLGVPHHVIDSEALFEREVIRPFMDGYLGGQTPSPCIRCNSRVKFRELFSLAATMGADAVATGHYARRVRLDDGTWRLCRGVEPGRDQSYFLFELQARELARAAFPLGGMDKRDVRSLARRLGLASADRRDSQEVCFVPEGYSYAAVIDRLAGDRAPGAGPIVSLEGEVLGRHDGVHRFTVGQRRGLGVSGKERLYVVAIDPGRRTVIAGPREAAMRREIRVVDVTWHGGEPRSPFKADVQVRSRHEPAAGVVTPLPGGGGAIRFDEPVLAPSPGQAAVFYEEDRVIGGGWITAAGGPASDGASPA